ncbi:hypothetical protein NDU88_002930 [Pleurodeles waltl]|uniref:C2H2-type domain-containing protein n=1 Tax=Pleurodeles waltl TaxID=8319 RepID=A0AAV7KX51_PLEWA|nr:hypothetical protein NDU88_002930 [Pleurodeles waltl]
MRQGMNRFSTACRDFSLTISTKKTEVLHQLTSQKTHMEPTITSEGEILKAVDKFIHLGITLSTSVNIDTEVDTCIIKASSVFRWLWELVRERRCVKLSTKLKMYKAVILPTLLYACETWIVYERPAKKLNCLHMNSLRRLLKITWQDKVPDTAVLSQAGLPSIYTQATLYICQTYASPRYCSMVNWWKTNAHKGGQKKHFKDTLKVSLKSFGLDPDTWEILAQYRPTWQSCISKDTTSYKQSSTAEAQKKLELCKFIANSLPTNPADHLCLTCGRAFRALIRLISHSRTHRAQSTSST